MKARGHHASQDCQYAGRLRRGDSTSAGWHLCWKHLEIVLRLDAEAALARNPLPRPTRALAYGKGYTGDLQPSGSLDAAHTILDGDGAA